MEVWNIVALRITNVLPNAPSDPDNELKSQLDRDETLSTS